ncbi:MAG: TAXI family TRAP transporter solute-binding subunit [Thermodesulfobacteriota bacterium]|nr:TAXI family TRAP transporter solute-binding subunit [Thermodesulfobacteriota bacterium]
MGKKKIFIGIYILIIGLVFSMVCFAGGPKPLSDVKMPESIVWKGMSSPGSGYDILTRPALNNISKAYPKLSIQHLPGGTKAGFDRVEKDEAQIATVYIGDGAFAWYGRGDYKTQYRHLRTFYQYAPMSTAFMVTLRDSDINGLKDLANKRVHMGVAGWTTTRNSLPPALKLHGITVKSIRKNGGFVYYGAMGSAMDMLSSGKLDIVTLASFQPMGLVTQLNETQGIKIISFTPDEIQEFCMGAPGYVPVTLPSGLYKGQESWPNPTPTICAYTGLYLVRDTVPEDVVYNLLCAIFADDGTAYNEAHPALKNVDFIANGYFKDYNPVPLHPGAKRYWKERGSKIAPSWVEKWNTWPACEKGIENLVKKTIDNGFPIKYLK